jgi:serine protease AprX
VSNTAIFRRIELPGLWPCSCRCTGDGLTWGLKQLNIPKVWETSKGKAVNVAVLDTGVHGDHPVLHRRVKDFVVIDPLGRRIKATPCFDSGRHGTHVCGTIAGGKTPDGVAIGVAPEANLLVAGVLIGDATLLSFMEGISWAVEKGADIISMSLGFSYYEPLFAEVLRLLLGFLIIFWYHCVTNSSARSTG